ncbi:MAG: undecaprenyldiphospho-muramoylpentapeptide beta-N-acetylglucosaminyltransferase [Candidatus Cloacimonetes bacterium]|nr:undecaprenyldiphospho-muramoylpentapeptide beta-N-acetylglucosaminyltransferase [Candidatus Cloacimonadota bacterium]
MAERLEPKVKNSCLSFVLGCGGTGGHIYPAIAIAQQLQQLGHKVSFIGNRGGMEETLITGQGYAFKGIRVQKLYRRLSLANLLFPFLLVSSTLACLRLLHQNKAGAVICTGGFVSGPIGIAAALLRIPLYLHESNSYPGITTKYLARHSRFVFTGFSDTAKHLPRANIRELGIPLAQAENLPHDATIEEISLDGSKPILLVTGGSQGSLAINSTVAAALPRLLELGWQVIWQTGQAGYEEFAARFSGHAGIYVFAFSPQLKNYYQLARVAVTRAGAMTIAELIENRLPAVLIPLPTAAENHQHYNALEQQRKGQALLLRQSELTGDKLVEAISQVGKNHPSYLEKLEQAPPNTAAEDIAREILTDLNKEQHNAGKN